MIDEANQFIQNLTQKNNKELEEKQSEINIKENEDIINQQKKSELMQILQ